ncbi:MAG: hypothetical protein WCI73_21145, partial [Phycisphaerae bacterium]
VLQKMRDSAGNSGYPKPIFRIIKVQQNEQEMPEAKEETTEKTQLKRLIQTTPTKSKRKRKLSQKSTTVDETVLFTEEKELSLIIFHFANEGNWALVARAMEDINQQTLKIRFHGIITMTIGFLTNGMLEISSIDPFNCKCCSTCKR